MFRQISNRNGTLSVYRGCKIVRVFFPVFPLSYLMLGISRWEFLLASFTRPLHAPQQHCSLLTSTNYFSLFFFYTNLSLSFSKIILILWQALVNYLLDCCDYYIHEQKKNIFDRWLTAFEHWVCEQTAGGYVTGNISRGPPQLQQIFIFHARDKHEKLVFFVWLTLPFYHYNGLLFYG